MTAADALRALAKQGRIAQPWLPGMRCSDGSSWARVVGLPVGRKRLLIAGDWVLQPPDSDGIAFESVEWLSGLDLQDPATVGHCLALLREAMAPWTPHPVRGCGAVAKRDTAGWHVWVWTGPGAHQRFDGATEGEAIAAALVWLATVGAPAGAR